MKTKTVLVVDDSETIRNQVARALQTAGFDVLEAGDGVEGLEQLANNEIALVILDVNMPILNGIEMLTKVRANPRTANIPVLMLTTEVHQTMIQRGRDAGASGWIIKPVKVEHLVSAVNKLAA
jgi:two-component system chemotaxis response regulator CheY